MNILVVNDDGIEAPGIRLLAQTMQGFGQVKVVAPHTQQSAIGHGITIHDPIRLRERPDYLPDVQAWSIDAKPADCVKFALYALHLSVDLVVSGINDGPNLGTDIMYSGTLGGASEGIICGIPSISFSTDFSGWDLPSLELRGVVQQILEKKLIHPDHVLNVNFPKKEFARSKGIRVTEMGDRPFLHQFDEADEPGLYWARGTWDQGENHEGTDVWAYENGFISLSPIQINRTNYGVLKELRRKIQQDF